MGFVPFKIGRYDVFEVLGRGGMGEVYRARLTGAKGFEKDFAVKSFHAGSEIEKEAKLCSLLNFPSIVQVYDFIDTGETHYLIMEYVAGKTLSKILAQSRSKNLPLPIELSLYLMLEMAKTLVYAHDAKHPKTGLPLNIVHRDISPQNIMLNADGQVKLLDFGIAKVSEYSNTATGTVVGKISYLSPEQASGQRVDRRTDLYSLSLVMYELLLGVKALRGETDWEVLEKARTGAWAEDGLARLKGATEVVAILKRGLARDRAKRYSTATEMHQDLQSAISRQYLPFGPTEAAKWIEGLFGESTMGSAVSNQTPLPTQILHAPSTEHLKGSWLTLRKALLLIAAFALLATTLLKLPRPKERKIAQDDLAQVCIEEGRKLCPGLELYTGLLACMVENKAKLSPACQK